MKIYQLSAEWCSPCKMARRAIETIEGHKDWWEWVDVEKDNGEERNGLVSVVKPRSVPSFVVADFKSYTVHEVMYGYSKGKLLELKEKYAL